MIDPTVGRVVWYHPTAEELDKHGHAPPAPGQPLAAHIASLQSPRIINLMVLDANGNPFSRTAVYLLQDDETPPEDLAYAAWMPYQKGQAAKTEALEAKTAAPRADANPGAGGEPQPGQAAPSA